MACSALLLATAPGVLQAAVQIRAIRVGLDTEHTRLVLESDRPIRARVTRDPASGMLFLDLDGVTADGTLAGLGKAIGANNPFITGVRLYPRATGTRLALAGPVAVTARLFHLRPDRGHADRLVMDLFPAAPDWLATRGSSASRPVPPADDRPQPTASAETPARAPREVPAATVAAGAARVRAVRVALAADRVRLVLESDRPLRASVAHPTEPGGPLVIDLGDVAVTAALAGLAGKIQPNRYLTSARISHEGTSTRLELLTAAPATPQIFNLKPVDGHGDRLVVDIFPDIPPPPPSPPAASLLPPAAIKATPAPATRAAPPVPTADTLSENWLEVQVNGTPQDTVLVLQDAAGHVWVRAEDLLRWRIRLGAVAGITHGADQFYPLAAISGLASHVDPARGALQIEVPASLFLTSRFSGVSRGADEPTPSPPGAYVNYDVFAGHEARGPTHASALVETGVFGRWGSGVTSFLARRPDGVSHSVRLDSSWTRDQPAEMTSLHLGDAVSVPGSWGRALRFGGLQWGTNFATRPGFITFPMPATGGVATAPSTVDIYVNNILRLRRDVPSGPFTIQDLPVITGQGEMRMVVRDMLGREQVVAQPFYAGGGLLASGLRDHSYEIGFERENYGLVSNDYGRLIASATERRGFSDRFTGELHAEATRGQLTVGTGGNLLLGNAGVLSAALAGSHDAAGSGALLELGFQRQSRYFSYGARTQLTTARFVQLGYQPPTRPPRQTSTAFLSVGTGRFGSFGINYIHQDYRERDDVEMLGANYSTSLGRLGYLSLSALRFLGDDGAPLFTLTFTVPLDGGDSASFSGQAQGGGRHGNVQYQHNLPAGTGVGYRLQAGLAASDPRLADLSLQNDVGTYTFGVAASQGEHAYQASARGGLAMLGGRIFPSRHIDDSFAVVQVPGFANVRVYADNQQVATTDGDGYALVPRLRPYQKNPIRIEQADLPLDARIQGLELDAVPYDHSALALTFPVSRSRGALLVIKLADGSLLPAGAEVAIVGAPAAFPVGMHGEVYLTDLQEINRLDVSWRGQHCDLVIRFPATSEPLPRLGPLTCRGIDP